MPVAPELAALERALAAPLGCTLAHAIPAHAQTAVVFDPRLPIGPEVITRIVGELGHQGIPPGRLDLVVGALRDFDGRRLERANPEGADRAWSAALGSHRIHRSDPERSRIFRVAEIGGVAIELDDLIRECESVIVVGGERVLRRGAASTVVRAEDSLATPWAGLLPGLAGPATRTAIAARGCPASEWLEEIPVEFAIVFEYEAGESHDADGWRIVSARAGDPRAVWKIAASS